NESERSLRASPSLHVMASLATASAACFGTRLRRECPAQGRATRFTHCQYWLSGVGRLRVGDRVFPRQRGDHAGLGAQLQMQVEENDQADADPDVEDKVDAAADPDQF